MKKQLRHLLTALIIGLGLSLSPITQVLAEQPSAMNGKNLFSEKCAMCHRKMGMGTMMLERRLPRDQALLENRQVPTELVKQVVRNGLGIMFSISRAEVSDEQLDLIAHYLSQKNTTEPKTVSKEEK